MASSTPKAPGTAGADVLDLAAFARPVRPVRFPTGTEYPVVPFVGADCARARKVLDGELADLTEAQVGAEVMDLLRLAVPAATAEDWATLDEDGRMAAAILGAAMRKANLVLAALGNAGAGPHQRTTSQRTRRSARKTRSATS